MSRDRKRSKDKGSKFKYNKRSTKSVEKRGNQSANEKDFILKDDVNMFKVNDGDNLFRPLPPTWEDAEHYGMDIYVHYGVGADNATYLCRNKMLNEACPICEERERADSDGDADYAKELSPKKRVMIYLIDRDHEDKGPQVWTMPWGLDRDICKLSVDKRSGEVMYLDDPEDGYDVEFEKTGTGLTTKYEGVAVARKPSDLGDDAWLDQIEEHPLPDILNYFEYDHIDAIFNGGSGGAKDEEKGEESPRNSRDKKDTDDDPEYTVEDIEDMSRRKLEKLAKELKIDKEEVKESDDDQLIDILLDELGLGEGDPEVSEEEAEAEPEPEEEEEKPSRKSKLDEIKGRRKKRN